tara:strand:+ start:703 stop:1281 length:579 start_codon:yes stop_codon:yes gene_type:complete
MTRDQAMYYIASKYGRIKEIVKGIEDKYFRTQKGIYHEDITQDMFLKIYNELDKKKDDTAAINKFLDRYFNPKSFNIYTIVRNLFVSNLRKENKYIRFDYSKLSKDERARLIEEAKETELKNTKSIEEKIDEYVDTFYWFDKKLFNLYRYEFKAHPNEMSKKTNLSVSTIYRTVKRCKIRINEKLRKQYYEK